MLLRPRTLALPRPLRRIRTIATASYSVPLPSAPEKKESTTARGTAYELACIAFLERELAMRLRRVGGKDDGGVDLRGWMYIARPDDLLSQPRSPALDPASSSSSKLQSDLETKTKTRPRRIRILAQCKAESKKLGPKYIRELEGTLLRSLHSSLSPSFSPATSPSAPPSPSPPPTHSSPTTSTSPGLGGAPPPTLALLLSPLGFTPSTLSSLQSSSLPLAVVHLERPAEGGRCRGVVWNRVAGEVLGGGLQVRRVLGGDGAEKVRIRVDGAAGEWEEELD